MLAVCAVNNSTSLLITAKVCSIPLYTREHPEPFISFHSVTYKIGFHVELISPVRRLGLLAGILPPLLHSKIWGSSPGAPAFSPASPALELSFLHIQKLSGLLLWSPASCYLSAPLIDLCSGLLDFLKPFKEDTAFLCGFLYLLSWKV